MASPNYGSTPGDAPAPAVQAVNTSQQKKVLEDVLETIVRMKADFFENHHPITDDSVILQRFCAKFEHLLQMGLKGKTSLLGRKKDYWDYFCDCLGASKGSNEGIKYVKSLGENKTSLGRGRAFIRFCLVHQRLADAIQQCLVHDKSKLWFMPGSIFLNGKQVSPLINALYDLNSMHFDLAPRGYDLDSVWPSFANRKLGGSGSWNVPISRRSSITSMDTLSQISVSMADPSEMDKLAKDLEEAQSVKDNLIGQLDTLQQEKAQASQSAWSSQGELHAIQEQLSQLQTKHSELQERYHNLDLNYAQLKMERDHIERLRQDEMQNVKDEETKRVQQLKEEETIWKMEMKEENERRSKELDRLKRELDKKSSDDEARGVEIEDHWSSLQRLMAKLNIETVPGDFSGSISSLESHVTTLKESADSLEDKTKQLKNSEDQVSALTSQLADTSQQLENAKKSVGDFSQKTSSLQGKLEEEKDISNGLKIELLVLKENLSKREDESSRVSEKLEEMKAGQDKMDGEMTDVKKQRDDLLVQLREKEKDVKELNQTMKENLPVFAQSLEETKTELAKSKEAILEKDKEIAECKEKIKAMEADIVNHVQSINDKESQILKLEQDSDKVKSENTSALDQKGEEISKLKSKLIALEAKVADLTQDAEKTKVSLESMKRQSGEAEARLAESEEKLLKNAEDLKEQKRIKEELENERGESQAKLESLSSDNANLQQTIEILKSDVKIKEKEKESLQVDFLTSQTELECLKVEMDAEKNQRMLLLQASDDVKKSDSEKSQQISNLFVQTESLKNENTSLEQQVKELQQELAQEVEQKSSLGSELDRLKADLQTNIDEKDRIEYEYKSQIESSGHRKEEVAKRLLKGAHKALQSLNQTLNTGGSAGAADEDVQTMTSDCDENQVLSTVEEVFDKLNQMCSHQREEAMNNQEMVGGLSDELTSVQAERDLLLKQTDAALDDAHQIKSQLTQTSEQLAIAYSSIETFESENSSLKSELSRLNDEIHRQEKDKDEMLNEIDALKDACRRAEDEAQSKLSEKRDLEIELEDVSSQLKTALSEKAELETAVGSLNSQTDFSTKVLEESLVDSKNALEAAVEEKQELQGQVVNLMAKIGQINANVKQMKEENENYKEEIEAMKNSPSTDDSRSAELEKLKETLEKEREGHDSAIEMLNQQISALEFELSAEQMMNANKTQTSDSGEEIRDQLSALESQIDHLTEENSQLKEKLKWQEGLQITENSELHRQVQTQEKELSLLKDKLAEVEEELKSVTEVKNKAALDLVQLRFSFKAKGEAADKELETLRSDNKQLKKKIVQLVKDKDNLWQKTDQLVDERKRKANERWQGNAEVTKCTQCRAEFSLFLRKHHCRKCGRIFCYSCSDNWVDTPHSSKKARVCNACFELSSDSLESSKMATSLIDQDSEEEEQGGDNRKSSAIGSSDRMSLSNASTLSRTSSIPNEGQESGLKGNDKDASGNSPSECVGDGDDNNATPDGATAAEGPAVIDVDAVVAQTDHSATERSTEVDGDNNGDDDDDDEGRYQMVTEEEVQKSITEFESSSQLANVPANMSQSMVLSADDLETGKVNRQSEVWIKPGKMFAVPVKIDQEGSTLSWEFSSHPKDIVFAIYYRVNAEAIDAEETVAPCKCNAHKQASKGELTAKQRGIYTLVFDNTYSRLTSKKVHYQLEYRSSLPK